MAHEAERLEILKMVEAGKVSPEEGMRLLRALGKGAAPRGEGEPAVQAGVIAAAVGSEPAGLEADVTTPATGTAMAIEEIALTQGGEEKARCFRLLVEEPSGQRVDLRLPLQAVPLIVRAAARWVPEDYRNSLTAAAQAVETGFRGDILAVEEPSGERVRIWIE